MHDGLKPGALFLVTRTWQHGIVEKGDVVMIVEYDKQEKVVTCLIPSRRKLHKMYEVYFTGEMRHRFFELVNLTK